MQLCNSLNILWHCLPLGLEWKLTFSSSVAWIFHICCHIECKTFTASSFGIWKSSAGIPSPPLALFVVMILKAHLSSHSRMSGSRWVTTPLCSSLHEIVPLVSPIFLDEISNLSHSIVFLYCFALITEESFLMSPHYSLELCIQIGISFLFSLPFASLLFSAICKASSDNHFVFLNYFFLGMILIPATCTMSRSSTLNSSGTLSDLSLESVCYFHYIKRKWFDLGHTWMV